MRGIVGKKWLSVVCGSTVLIVVNVSFGQSTPSEDPPTLESVETAPSERSNKYRLFATPSEEWVFHKTADGSHPDGNEQAMVWLMNRARSNPRKEGLFFRIQVTRKSQARSIFLTLI